MSLKEKVEKFIQEVNPKLKRMAGAYLDLLDVDEKEARVSIKIIQHTKNTC